MSKGNTKFEFSDWVNNFNPRVTGLSAKKGTLFRYIPAIGVPVQLLKNDDGFSTNWSAAGEGDQASVYLVGTGDLMTIQSAIDLAFAEGSGTGGKIATIYIPPGSYTENLIFQPGQNLIAQSSAVATGAIIIEGQHSYTPPVNTDPLDVLVSLQGLTFYDPLPGHTVSMLGTEGALFSITGCAFIKDSLTGSAMFSAVPVAIFVVNETSSTTFNSADPFIESASSVTVVQACSHQSGGIGPMINCSGAAFTQFNRNECLGSPPYIASFSGGQVFMGFNNLTSFAADSDCLRVGAGCTVIATHNTLTCPTGLGYVLQGVGTVNGAMLVYGDNNVKDPGLTFNLLSSDP